MRPRALHYYTWRDEQRTQASAADGIMTRKQPCLKWNDPCGVRMLWKCVHGLFRSKRGNVGQLLTQISLQTNTTEPTAIRTQVLRGLPIILGDNPRNLFEAGFESDDDDSFY
ncbi:hypothetical protein UPYG_G00053700 [Umbra pygmaea]|uniref:Uncharacterized protein n=1 Tax=Umbra pygmaea TaxID=75934 RepID=A0ABD0XMX5_UMBPY